MKERFLGAVRQVAVLGFTPNRDDRRSHLSTEAVPALKELGLVILCDQRLTWRHKRRLMGAIRAAILDHYTEEVFGEAF